MILQLLNDMKDVLLILLGAILSITTTWIANKQLHKMNLRQLAVQNKLETSKTAIIWLMDVRGKLQTIIWMIEHRDALTASTIEYAKAMGKQLESLEQEAREYFNAIELYYNFDDVTNRYDLNAIAPQVLDLINRINAILQSSESADDKDIKQINEELLAVCMHLYDATIDITEIIRQDNMKYLK